MAITEPATFQEVLVQGRDMLYALALTSDSGRAAATMGWAAGLLAVTAASIVADPVDETRSTDTASDSMKSLRALLDIPESESDTAVAAQIHGALLGSQMEVSEYMMRISSALKRHEADSKGDCRTCGVPHPCPTRSDLEV